MLTQSHIERMAPHEAWKTVAKAYKKTAKSIPGVKEPNKKSLTTRAK